MSDFMHKLKDYTFVGFGPGEQQICIPFEVFVKEVKAGVAEMVIKEFFESLADQYEELKKDERYTEIVTRLKEDMRVYSEDQRCLGRLISKDELQDGY